MPSCFTWWGLGSGLLTHDAFFLSCFSGFSLSKGSRCFWLLHPCLHITPQPGAGAVLTPPACTTLAGCPCWHVDLQCIMWERPSKHFLSPLQQLSFKGQSLCHFFKATLRSSRSPSLLSMDFRHFQNSRNLLPLLLHPALLAQQCLNLGSKVLN